MMSQERASSDLSLEGQGDGRTRGFRSSHCPFCSILARLAVGALRLAGAVTRDLKLRAVFASHARCLEAVLRAYD